MWEGKALVYLDAPLQLLGFGFGLFSLFSSSPQPPDYTPFLDQINQTTLETLDRVKSLQDQLTLVQAELVNIRNDIKDLKCSVETARLDADTRAIQDYFWYNYQGSGSSSILYKAQKGLEAARKSGWAGVNPRHVQDIADWSRKALGDVPGEQGIFAHLQSFHNIMMGTRDLSPRSGALLSCATAAFAQWQPNVFTKDQQGMPVLDDRQFYTLINLWFLDKIAVQAEGMQMLRDALLWKAQDVVKQALQSRGATNATWSIMDPGTLCGRAYQSPEGSPMHEAVEVCDQLRDSTNQVYDNLMAQVELLGQPLSFGDQPGEGLRLLLGSEVLGFEAFGVDDRNAEAPRLKGRFTESRWLFPASLPQFDPRCTAAIPADAERLGCSAVGVFRSCGTGCNVDGVQEALWRQLERPLGYPAELFSVAGADAWTDLRATYTSTLRDKSDFAEGDVLALMEKPDDQRFYVPFTDMTTRAFWVVNATATAYLYDLAFGQQRQGFQNFSWTFTPYCNVKPGRDPCGPDRNFTFRPPRARYATAQCLAAHNPMLQMEQGRRLGASGVHCATTDFPALHDRTCLWGRDGPAMMQYTPLRCHTGRKKTLDRFGTSLGPSPQQDGSPWDGAMEAACAWDCQHACEDTSDRYGGSCHLVSRPDYMIEHPGQRPSPGNPLRPGYFRDFWRGCELQTHPPKKSGYSTDPYWSDTCTDSMAGGFSYPWLPQLIYDNQSVFRMQPDPTPRDARTRKLHRLPVLDLATLPCTPSLSLSPTPSDPSRRNRTLLGWPTRCGDDMTRAVMNALGPGQYEADAGSSTATLSVGPDMDSITCTVNWGPELHKYVTTTNVFITVRDGPAYAGDNVEYTGTPADPGPWLVRTVDLFNPDPAAGPTPAPTFSPTTPPSTPWTGSFKTSCSNCKTVQTGAGASLQCTCPDGKGNSALSTCYASCCPGQSASNVFGALGCDGGGSCTDLSTGGACWKTTDWVGSYKDTCTNCKVMERVVGAPFLQCACANGRSGNPSSTCYASCCPSRSASNINGVLTCDGGAGSCTDAGSGAACAGGLPSWDLEPADPACVCRTEPVGLYFNTTRVTCTCPDPWARSVTSVCYSDCCPSRSLRTIDGRLACAGYGPCVGSGNASCQGQPAPPRTSVSLQAALPPASRNGTRVIGCHVRGLDPVTRLPVSVDAVSKIGRANASAAGGWEWEDFGFPYRTAPCNTSGCIDTGYRGLAHPGQAFATATGAYSGGPVLMALDVAAVAWLTPTVGPVLPGEGKSVPAPDVLWAIPGPSARDPEGGAGQVDAQFDGLDQRLFVASPQVTLRNGVVTPAIVSLAFDNATGAYVQRALVGTGGYSCVTDQQARYTGFKDLSGAWRHPETGDLFTVDTGCGLLYRIDARALDDAVGTGDGRVRAVANLTAFPGAAAFQRSASSASPRPVRLAGDATSGTLYVAYVEQCGIVKVNINTGAFAGWALVGRNQQPVCGFSGDGNLAVGQDAAISRGAIGALAWDDDNGGGGGGGSLYIADTGNQRVRVVSSDTGLITTVAGNGLRQSTGDRGPAVDASLSCPTGLAVAQVGLRKALFITEGCSGFVRRVLLD